ncbi:MAG TPA: hypothetical protein VGF93_19255 [Solirubrobacteraceae bacterium]
MYRTIAELPTASLVPGAAEPLDAVAGVAVAGEAVAGEAAAAELEVELLLLLPPQAASATVIAAAATAALVYRLILFMSRTFFAVQTDRSPPVAQSGGCPGLSSHVP